MNLKQMSHFLKLKKIYAYELAVSKTDIGPIDDEELYESLALLDLNTQLTSVLNTFLNEYEATRSGEEVVCPLTSMAFLLDGIIKMEAHDEEDEEDLKFVFDDIFQSINSETKI